jgi:hypothetical protein
MSKKFTSLLSLVMLSWSLMAQDIYVSPTGDDTNDGSQASPVATISQAINLAGVGSTVFVQGDGTNNTYTYAIGQTINVNKSLTLSGVGQAVRITTSQNMTDLLALSTSGITVEGLILDASGDNGTSAGNVIKITAIFNVGSTDINILQNTIVNADIAGISIEGNNATVSDLTISNNFINSNATGLQVNIPLTGNSRIFENDLSGNQSRALNNTSGQPVNASLNWWGSEAYASVILSKTGNVDINPWFRSGANFDTRPDLDGFQSLYTPLGIKKLNANTNVLEEAAQAVLPDGSIFIYYTDAANLIYNTLSVDKSFTIEGFPNPSFPDTSIPAIRGIVTNGGALTVKGRINVLANPADDNYAIRLIDGNIDASEGRVSVDMSGLVDYTGGDYNGSLSISPTTVAADEPYIAPALGVVIQSGPEPLGEVSVTRTTGPNGITTFGDDQQYKSIAVRWAINVENQPSAQGRNIRLEWTSDYDNGIDVSDAFIWRKENESTPWELVATNKIGITSTNLRVIDVDNVTQFSSWTVSDVNNPLPVELTAFNARLEEPHVQLNWETASEENADFFAIERSESGQEFTQIGTIQAAGDSDTPLQYSYLDEQVANRFGGTLFYRLRTVDFDGSYEYSDITSVFINDEGTPMISAFAREGQESMKLFTRSIEPGDYHLWVTDLSGRKLYEQEVQLANNEEHRINIGNLPRSIYMIRCVGKQLVLATKFKVE